MHALTLHDSCMSLRITSLMCGPFSLGGCVCTDTRVTPLKRPEEGQPRSSGGTSVSDICGQYVERSDPASSRLSGLADAPPASSSGLYLKKLLVMAVISRADRKSWLFSSFRRLLKAPSPSVISRSRAARCCSL